MPRSPRQSWSISNRLRESPMQKPPLDPDVADTAPSNSVLTAYDEEHVITYLRLLDADAEGADWRSSQGSDHIVSAINKLINGCGLVGLQVFQLVSPSVHLQQFSLELTIRDANYQPDPV
jgi:hypothetical protein